MSNPNAVVATSSTFYNYKLHAEEQEAMILPGYDYGIGIEHSQRKLRCSADRLTAKLVELQSSHPASHQQQQQRQQEYSGVLRSVSHDRSGSVVEDRNGNIQTFHCTDEKETWTYRCRCNFQIVRVTPDGVPTVTPESSTSTSLALAPSSLTSYRYAMRSMGKPVLLGTTDPFPIATRRIQTAMEEFLQHLNNTNTNEINNEENDWDSNGDRGGACVDPIIIGHNGHLTSCTFSSAWRDVPDADCVLTLHYDHPLDDDETTKNSWKRHAGLLCQKLRLRQLNGRSKGILLSVKRRDNEERENGNCDDDDDEGEAIIRDTIYLLRSNREDRVTKTDGATITDEWKVSLDPIVPSEPNSTVAIPVHYDKPETAFYHPNPNAMTTALAWMLNRLASISSSSPLNLLEMYCGCGAHTVALGRSGLVSHILAVELDPRLVRACESNVETNSLRDLVEVRRGDAARWAKEESRKRRSLRRKKDLVAGTEVDCQRVCEIGGHEKNYYDVLLVDPPRQGLDEEVCRMAMMTTDGEMGGDGGNGDGNGNGNGNGNGTDESCFRNILYVSCGHRALLRDLERLAPVYEVVNCAQMDLFPRTDSIETLVHLQRRDS